MPKVEKQSEEIKVKEEVSIDQMPLETFEDYKEYNKRARQINKKLGILRYPIRQCPIELHPTQRIVFSRNDQPENPLPVHVSNHLIHFEKTLIPGQTYDLPHCVIEHLASLGYPAWKWRERADGSRETFVSGRNPRFSLRTVYNQG